METHVESAVCTPGNGKVFPGTWPDCLDCHGVGYAHKHEPTISCQTCQERSAAINHSLSSLIEFDYYGRPKNYVPAFPRPGETWPPAWKDITWAELYGGTGVYAGTWPNCTECRGLGQERYESSWDGHRSDYDWRKCGTCQRRTRLYHIEHPNEKDLLLQRHAAEMQELQNRHKAELAEIGARHQVELEALPY